MTEWIKCSDRLPDENTHAVLVVLVDRRGADVMLGSHWHDDRWTISGGNYWDRDYMGEVTHWAPLPVPPVSETAPNE
jgi:hypothetical protein